MIRQLAVFTLFTTMAAAAPAEDGKKMTVSGKLTGGWSQIGGETTGWQLEVSIGDGKGYWEVNMQGISGAASFDGAEVTISGTTYPVQYVERGKAWILRAEKIVLNPAVVPKPIAHWKLDDVGAVARDSAGKHHGRVVGARSVPGKIGKALEFVRKDAQHVEIPYAADLALSTFTVSAWVRLTREPTFSGILGSRHGGEHTFDLKVNAAKVHGDIGDGKSWIETAVNFYQKDTGTNGEGGDLALDRWYHIAYVIDGSSQECRLYLDADLKKRIAFEGKPMLMTPTNTLRIGHSSGTEFMDGLIDEVKIWNQALKPEHVRSEWNRAKGASVPES